MYKRKTVTEFEIQGYYKERYRWECLTTEDTYKEAKTQLKYYDENEPDFPHRIVRKRVKI